MHRIAEGIEDRRDFVGDIVRDRDDVGFGDREVFGETARAIDADAKRVTAKVPAPGPAVAAGVADHMALARNPLTDPILGGRLAAIDDLAAELVTHDHGHGHRLGRPFIPFPDMHIRAADRRLPDLDQHFVRTGFGHRHMLHPKPFLWPGFHQGLHFIAHVASPLWKTSHRHSTPAAIFAGWFDGVEALCLQGQSDAFGLSNGVVGIDCKVCLAVSASGPQSAATGSGDRTGEQARTARRASAVGPRSPSDRWCQTPDRRQRSYRPLRSCRLESSGRWSSIHSTLFIARQVHRLRGHLVDRFDGSDPMAFTREP